MLDVPLFVMDGNHTNRGRLMLSTAAWGLTVQVNACRSFCWRPRHCTRSDF